MNPVRGLPGYGGGGRDPLRAAERRHGRAGPGRLIAVLRLVDEQDVAVEVTVGEVLDSDEIADPCAGPGRRRRKRDLGGGVRCGAVDPGLRGQKVPDDSRQHEQDCCKTRNEQ